MAEVIKEPLVALREAFGFDRFREGQGAVVEKILSGQDGLVVMPTGGGKSLCYQLPALCLRGVTLVISPLIALMKDQVDALVERGIAATVINSTMSYAQQQERIADVARGQYQLVYVAPERFRSESFMRSMVGAEIALVAVDEAHCLSQWGHDFRPDYMRLGTALGKMGSPQCVALTATATAVVREDILRVLKLREPFEMVSGFARPNLAFHITATQKHHAKYARIKQIVKQWKTGIIYCATRKRVEEVAEKLHDWGVNCVAYHGGMTDQMREEVQNAFISKEVDVAVATNAFGMGIDRSDVRFVVHFEIPGSVEAYYQEAGRAGRDGKASFCELFFNYADTRTQEFFIEGVNPSVGDITKVYQHLLNQANENYEVQQTLESIKDGAGLKNGMAVGSALGILVRQKMIERFDVAGSRVRGTRLLQPEVLSSQLKLDRVSLEQKERRDRDKLHAMIELCSTHVCRQQWIMEYFGETQPAACGSCDVCTAEQSSEARAGSEAEINIVRKALSGVARMSEKKAGEWQGRYGRGKIVLMLMGSQAQDIVKLGLDRLSTYGLLKEKGTNYLNALFKAMHDARLVTTQRGDFPLLTLTERGEEVMHNRASFQLIWPKTKKNESPLKDEGVTFEEFGFNPKLYEALKQHRASIAKRRGVPVYVVFSNKTLEYMTRLQPTTIEQGMQIKGIGEMKAKQYLKSFLDVIHQFSG